MISVSIFKENETKEKSMRHLSPFISRNINKSLFSDFDDFFEGFADQDIKNSLRFQPRADIEEHTNHFMLSFDLPGMKEDEINIEVKDNSLTVSGERVRENKSDDDKYHKSYERVHGSFMRTFTLPANLNSEEIEANYDDGVLHVLIPKKGTESTSTVKVQSGKKEGFFSKLLD